LVIVHPNEVDKLLIPLPIQKLWGVGPVTAEKLKRTGIHQVGDLRRHSPESLNRLFGNETDRFKRLAHGLDDRPVVPDRQAKSIGNERTFGSNLTDPETVRVVLFDEVEQVGSRLRKHGLFARTVSLKIRFGDFQTISRSTTLEDCTDGTADLWKAATALFDQWCQKDFQPVRLIGMSASQLSNGPGQLPLFTDPANHQQKKVDAITDQINARFGSKTIRRGGGLK
jgi:DNA polymerase-4